MKLLAQGQCDQHSDDEPAVMQADLDPEDASEFDLRAQSRTSTKLFYGSAGLDAAKVVAAQKNSADL